MNIDKWLGDKLPKHRRLTDSVVSITKSLLQDGGIEFLSVSGRTKKIENITEKIKRKSYKNPPEELTDISGIRIILFVESDIERASEIVKSAFNVDWKNSSNKDKNLLSNQVGYRSVHYVCDLGKERSKLPEFRGLEGLKFEFQIRTVLQHAWAELAHDRSYKFRGTLPDELQRSLYLHAGLLEIADQGFSMIAKNIDGYTAEVNQNYDDGNLNVPINSISLTEFIEKWTQEQSFPLEQSPSRADLMNDLIKELNGFGIHTVMDLKNIIPENYVQVAAECNFETNIYGLVRDWMVIHDVDKIMGLGVRWAPFEPDSEALEIDVFRKLSTPENYERILKYAFEGSHSEDDFERS